MFSKPITNRYRAIKQARRDAHTQFKQECKISNSVWATRLPYDSNDTTNYNRFAVDTKSQVKLEPTENEIIDMVLNYQPRRHGKADLRKLDPSCIGDEVRAYWQEKIKQSELKRGRLYIKANE